MNESTEATSTEATSTEATSTEATSTEATSTEATATEATATEATATEATATEATETTESNESTARAPRKVREGVVVSSTMDKTAVVAVIERVRHPRYNKFVNRTKRLYVHDETNDVNTGDRVRVMETRPLSKTKRWRITEVLERAK